LRVEFIYNDAMGWGKLQWNSVIRSSFWCFHGIQYGFQCLKVNQPQELGTKILFRTHMNSIASVIIPSERNWLMLTTFSELIESDNI